MTKPSPEVRCPNDPERECPRLVILARNEQTPVEANDDEDPAYAAGHTWKDTVALAGLRTEHACRAASLDCAKVPDSECPVSTQIAASRLRRPFFTATKRLLGLKK